MCIIYIKAHYYLLYYNLTYKCVKSHVVRNPEINWF